MKFVEATILYRKSWQVDILHTFSPIPPLRYSHHRAQARVRPTTPIHRLWFTVPENFCGPKSPLFRQHLPMHELALHRPSPA
jgi:hypothetical protein